MIRLTLVWLCFVLLVGVGCTSSPPEQGRTINQQASLRMEMNQEIRQLDATLAALEKLVAPGTAELPAQFQAFATEFDRLDAVGKRVQERNQAAQTSTRAYFADWTTRAQKIESPSIRDAELKRIADARAAYDAMTAQFQQSRQSLVPVVGKLREIRGHLSTSLTPDTLAPVRPVARSVLDSAPQVKTALRDAIDRLARSEQSLLPPA